VVFVLAISALGAGCSLLLSFDGISGGSSERDAASQGERPTEDDGSTEGDAVVPSADTFVEDLGATTDDGTTDAGCYGETGYHALVLCDHPAAYWRVGERGGPSASDEVEGGAIGVYDPSGTGGIQYGVPGAIVGDPDTAIHLNGTTSVSAGTALEFAGMAPFSLEAWVKPDLVDTNYRAFVSRTSWPDGGHRVGYNFWSRATGVGAERYSGAQAEQTALDTAALPTTTYSHVVATYDGGTLSVYENGTLMGSVLIQISVNSVKAVFEIGAAPLVSSPWIGSIDEVAVYAYALSAEQVNAHYRRGRGQ
jgi:hypothetical protein